MLTALPCWGAELVSGAGCSLPSSGGRRRGVGNRGCGSSGFNIDHLVLTAKNGDPMHRVCIPHRIPHT